jgi:stage II sporulation protein P
MNTEKRSARFGAAILFFSLLLRLIGGILSPDARAEGLLGLLPETFPKHRPTGGVSMISRPSQGTLPTVATQPTMPATNVPPPTVPIPPPGMVFSAMDMEYIHFQPAADCGYYPDLQALLLQPLDWQLTSDEPTVLIIHSHATEGYSRQPGEDYIESSEYRTLDTGYNMVAVGDLLAAQLQAQGIGVVHDRQLHDYPSYSMAYTNARRSVEAYLQEYPSIRMVLDLHRDAALNPDGSQYATSATVDGVRSAQVMLLAGTDWMGGQHPNWEQNLSLALKLQVLLEQQYPGITRQTMLGSYLYNQDLCTGMLIVEVGTAGNALQEALRAIPPLANAIAALAQGANRQP